MLTLSCQFTSLLKQHKILTYAVCQSENVVILVSYYSNSLIILNQGFQNNEGIVITLYCFTTDRVNCGLFTKFGSFFFFLILSAMSYSGTPLHVVATTAQPPSSSLFTGSFSALYYPHSIPNSFHHIHYYFTLPYMSWVVYLWPGHLFHFDTLLLPICPLTFSTRPYGPRSGFYQLYHSTVDLFSPISHSRALRPFLSSHSIQFWSSSYHS